MTLDTLQLWAEEIAAAFKAAGPDVSERGMSGARAFLVGDAVVGVVELKPGRLAIRLRLADADRAELEARAHYDRQAPIPTLLVVTEDDRDFVRGLIPRAYQHARETKPPPAAPAAPTAPRRRRRASR